MEEQYVVSLIGGSSHETAIFTLFEENDDCRLRCEYRDKVVERTWTDFFNALGDVRGLLANDGLIPFCYGASLHVRPSGMGRDMSKGLRAYKLALGRRPSIDDLVDIFAEGPDVVPASVSAQEQFFRDWLASLRL